MKGTDSRAVLVRLFLGRFFESELVPPGLPQMQIVIWALSLMAAPGYLLSLSFAARYGRLPPAQVPDAIATDQLLFLTGSMFSLGLVALVIWEAVFPDRRDVRILGVLPVPDTTHVQARLMALAGVAALFAVGANLPTAVVFGLTIWVREMAADPLRGVGAHLIASAMAGLFTFFLLIAIQGLALNVAGRRAARRLALVLQALFVIVLLQVLLFVPYLGTLVRTTFDSAGPTAGVWLPPFWFLALYDVLAATPQSVPWTLAACGALATGAAVGAAALLLGGSYRRLVRLAIEAAEGRGGEAWGFGAISRAIGRRATRDPVARAVGGFVARTLVRNRAHVTLLATYVGLAAALIVGGVIPVVVRRGLAGLSQPDVLVLSAPLIANFVLLCGVRFLLALPVELKANLAFRVNARETSLDPALRGVRATMALLVVVPVTVFALLSGLWLWSPRLALLHALFTVAAGLALLDVLLIAVRWIPFTRPYQAAFHTRIAWPLYLLAFGGYTYMLARVELLLMERPRGMIVGLVIMGAISVGATAIRRRALRSPPWLGFESADPADLFTGLGLSEGLAAEARARPVARGASRPGTVGQPR